MNIEFYKQVHNSVGYRVQITSVSDVITVSVIQDVVIRPLTIIV